MSEPYFVDLFGQEWTKEEFDKQAEEWAKCLEHGNYPPCRKCARGKKK